MSSMVAASTLATELAERLRDVTDQATLERVRRALHEPLDHDAYDILLRELSAPGEQDDGPLRANVDVPMAGGRVDRVAPVAFYLSLVACLVAGIPVTFLAAEVTVLSPTAVYVLVGIYFAIGLLLCVEQFVGGREFNRSMWGRAFVALIFPPARLVLRHPLSSSTIWLPGWRWTHVNISLSETLSNNLAMPLIGIALLSLPVLLVEEKYFEQVLAVWPGGGASLWVAMLSIQAFLWAAFAAEFLLMLSIAEDKVDYCVENWLDLIIVLLPIISFLRSLRVLRVLRLQQLGKAYRMKRVIKRSVQISVVLRGVQGMLRKNNRKELKRLRKKIRAHARVHAQLSSSAAAWIAENLPQRSDVPDQAA